ncbi:MAG: hypothetical protein K2K53_12115 [Oscillospiraceae bacterium]|nr:hypothetical protein [Oscillospiraceae bacterium]
MSFWKDVKTAVKLTGEIREARKEGTMVEIRRVWHGPMLKPTYWGNTMGFCLIHDREMEKAILAVFLTFPEPVQHSLTFSPKGPGEWVERARFWQQRLMPALPSKMYHAAIVKFISWYVHCLRMDAERIKATT